MVAVSHGRDTGAIPRFFRPARPIDCVFASAMGGSTLVDAPTNPNEICRALAETSGGRGESLYAPAYVESAEVRDRLLAQEAVAHGPRTAAARRTWRWSASAAPTTPARWCAAAASTLDEIAELREQGAVGDVLGNYVDVEGRSSRRRTAAGWSRCRSTTCGASRPSWPS